MTAVTLPKALSSGSHIRVIAPARSLQIISEESRLIADERLKELGFKLSFGKHVMECDNFLSSSVESRIADLHEAFADPDVDGILTVIGGFNSNQLLRHIDWELITNNPKVFCGYSDISVLNNAILAKSGLVTYSGPHYSSFGQQLHFDFTLDHFKRLVMQQDAITLTPSTEWSDDLWFINQNDRNLLQNSGYWEIISGEAKGRIVGGNLCSLNLLQGTEYMPDLKESILFLEDDSASSPVDFDRNLQSLIHLPEFEGVVGIVIGRFQTESKMNLELLTSIIKSKKELLGMPVIANVDFGHTDPKITIPIGGIADINHKAITIRHIFQ